MFLYTVASGRWEPVTIRNIQPGEMIKSAAIKAAGYAISTISVLLLGFVSWRSASRDPLLSLCLIIGMATSIAGMGLRWLSYRVEEDEQPSADR
ncbi:hypothetical protein FIM10_15495 [Sphingomonadales bacterium 56]|uniref:hypothetical protein n=1 Tax=unclassified Sphingobium TaxID=2611147 RepID=UPI0019192228|nr:MULTISPECIES: hypothetical protein [unclassified Sphingobium]MBY2930081.1 hypothetical protein [Sphingomonadales bacterium 56]MBY2960231.1 hypothetical protein [Sphingomonadales bacterium 58]